MERENLEIEVLRTINQNNPTERELSKKLRKKTNGHEVHMTLRILQRVNCIMRDYHGRFYLKERGKYKLTIYYYMGEFYSRMKF